MIRTSIVCDKCGAEGSTEFGEERPSDAGLWSEFHCAGWLIGAWSSRTSLSGHDYCPECKTWAINKAKAGKVKT